MNRPTSGDWVGGITSFASVLPILIVNPAILSGPANSPTGMAVSGIYTATLLVILINTLAMGLYARLPYVVAPGMGINAFFAFSLVLGAGVPWQTALGMTFWAGVLFLVLSLLPIREWIVRRIPETLRLGSGAGIGIFLILIAGKQTGWIVSDPDTLLRLGPWNPQTTLCFFGLVATVFLQLLNWRVAVLLPLIVMTWVWNWLHPPEHIPSWSLPDFQSVFFKLDVKSALAWEMVPAILAIATTDLLDSLSTFVGVARATGLHDAKGNPLRMRQGLLVDAVATLSAGLVGSSSGTPYVESAAGIQAGGKSGWTAVIAALCFFPFLFFSEWLSLFPPFVVGPALFAVGLQMLRPLRDLAKFDFDEALGGWTALVCIPLFFSITQGLFIGLLAHVLVVSARYFRKKFPTATAS